MKKMSVKKEILTIALILVVMLIACSQVFATGSSDSPVQIPIINTSTNSVDTNTETNVVENEASNEVIVPTTNTTTIAPITNTTGSTYQNQESLPQTGDASDYAIFMVIVLAALVAIYAYKKVRDYNI